MFTRQPVKTKILTKYIALSLYIKGLSRLFELFITENVAHTEEESEQVTEYDAAMSLL